MAGFGSGGVNDVALLFRTVAMVARESSIQRDISSKMAAVKCVCKTSYSVPGSSKVCM